MVLLALGAAFAGLLGSPVAHFELLHLLGESEIHEGIDVGLVISSTVVAAFGFALAWAVGFRRRHLLPKGLRPFGNRLYSLAANKYSVDEFYAQVIVGPFLAATQALSRFDLRVIDRAVDGAGQGGWSLGQLKQWFDQAVVDRCVNGVAQVVWGIGAWGRRLQTGIIQQYLLVVVVSAIVIAFVVQR